MGLVLLISYPKMAFRKMAFMRGWYIIFCIGETRGGRKKNGVRKKEVVAVEGTENATGDNSEIRRFLKRRGRLRELSFYRTLSINDEDP